MIVLQHRVTLCAWSVEAEKRNAPSGRTQKPVLGPWDHDAEATCRPGTDQLCAVSRPCDTGEARDAPLSKGEKGEAEKVLSVH